MLWAVDIPSVDANLHDVVKAEHWPGQQCPVMAMASVQFSPAWTIMFQLLAFETRILFSRYAFCARVCKGNCTFALWAKHHQKQKENNPFKTDQLRIEYNNNTKTQQKETVREFRKIISKIQIAPFFSGKQTGVQLPKADFYLAPTCPEMTLYS